MKVHFHKKKYKSWNLSKYTTQVIRLKSNDIFYHVSFELNGKYYESGFFNGVTRSSKPRNDIAHTIELNLNKIQTQNIVKEFNSMIGKKYDWLGVMLGFFGKKIQDNNKYFCSELFLPILKHAYGITQKDLRTNLSPKDVRMICVGIVAKNAK